MADEVRATGRHVPPLGRGAEPARPPPRARPVPGLGVQEPAAAVRPAAREAVRRAAAPATPPTSTRRSPTRRPDVVLCSQFAFGAMVAAEAAGHPVRRPDAEHLPAPAPRDARRWASACGPARGAAGRARDRFVRSMTQRMWDKGLRRLNDAARRARARAARPLHGPGRTRPAAVVLTSADFDFPADAARQRPLRRPRARRPELGRPTTWTPPPGDDPLVLVGLSSTFQDHGATAAAHRRRPGDAARPRHRDHRPGPRRRLDHRPRRTSRSSPSAPHAPGARARRRGRHPRRPRHGDQGARRRRPARRAPPRPRPGRQRGAGHRARRRGEARPYGEAVRHRRAVPVRPSPTPASAPRRALLGAAIRADAAGTALLDELEAVPAPELCRS